MPKITGWKDLTKQQRKLLPETVEIRETETSKSIIANFELHFYSSSPFRGYAASYFYGSDSVFNPASGRDLSNVLKSLKKTVDKYAK